uniref:Uncharacterized protein n=1 Tax=Oryza glumipatula TaxID=40148 RepID=A0A0D9Y8I2_9ORYZ
MGDGDGRAVAPVSVREAAMAIPVAVSEVPTEHFVRDIGVAMGVRFLACEATYYNGDLVGGALIPKPAANHGANWIPRDGGGGAGGRDSFSVNSASTSSAKKSRIDTSMVSWEWYRHLGSVGVGSHRFLRRTLSDVTIKWCQGGV